MLKSDVSDISFVMNHKQSAFMDVPYCHVAFILNSKWSLSCSLFEVHITLLVSGSFVWKAELVYVYSIHSKIVFTCSYWPCKWWLLFRKPLFNFKYMTVGKKILFMRSSVFLNECRALMCRDIVWISLRFTSAVCLTSEWKLVWIIWIILSDPWSPEPILTFTCARPGLL